MSEQREEPPFSFAPTRRIGVRACRHARRGAAVHATDDGARARCAYSTMVK